MNHVDENEYQRRVQLLMNYWGVSEIAILIYARENNADIRQDDWGAVFEKLTRTHFYGSSVETRDVGQGFLGREYAPGEAHEKPINVERFAVAGPKEPSVIQILAWNLRIRIEAVISRVLHRQI
jgi:hypothetical protein